MASQIKTIYKERIVPAFISSGEYTNVMQAPRIEKIVLNVGYGRHVKDKAFIENVEKTLTAITGQKPVHNKAKKAISNFKIREGMDIGMSVTLRGDKMYDFLYKLINIVFPRVRDFRGVSVKGCDRQGNYTVGMKESIAFPEVTAESLDKIHGLEISIKTTAKDALRGIQLLKQFGFPFSQEKN